MNVADCAPQCFSGALRLCVPACVVWLQLFAELMRRSAFTEAHDAGMWHPDPVDADTSGRVSSGGGGGGRGTCRGWVGCPSAHLTAGVRGGGMGFASAPLSLCRSSDFPPPRPSPRSPCSRLSVLGVPASSRRFPCARLAAGPKRPKGRAVDAGKHLRLQGAVRERVPVHAGGPLAGQGYLRNRAVRAAASPGCALLFPQSRWHPFACGFGKQPACPRRYCAACCGRACGGSEVRTLELLKLRFGEASLSTCEIMVCARWVGVR